jgi:hypothetical protein
MRTKVTMKSWRVFLGSGLLAAATAAPWAAAPSQQPGQPTGGWGCRPKLKGGILAPVAHGPRKPRYGQRVAKLVVAIQKAGLLSGQRR